MTKTTTFQFDGKNVTIDRDLLNGYITEAFNHYEQIEDDKQELKLIGEALAAATGIKATKIMKYVKARYDAKVRDAKAIGSLFENLDIAAGINQPTEE